MEDVGTVYGNWVYFTSILYILLPFGIFYGHLVYFMSVGIFFFRFGKLYQLKSGNPEFRRHIYQFFFRLRNALESGDDGRRRRSH
jgi:hypothetical protein